LKPAILYDTVPRVRLMRLETPGACKHLDGMMEATRSDIPAARLLVLIAAAAVAAGCASVSVPSYRECLRRVYLKTHKERPEPILEGIRSGRMTPGMNPVEAELCWGKPGRKTPLGNEGEAGETWIYEENTSGGESKLYDITVVKSRLTLTNSASGLVVSHWKTN
jgi:hypothetical protein